MVKLEATTTTAQDLEELIDELTFHDFMERGCYISGNASKLYDKLQRKCQDMYRQWTLSDEYHEYNRKERERLSRARDTLMAKKTARFEWVKANLKVGDWVKVTGTNSNCKTRKVLALSGTTFTNIQGDPLLDKVRQYSAQTDYGQVTHILDPKARLLVKVDVLMQRTPITALKE